MRLALGAMLLMFASIMPAEAHAQAQGAMTDEPARAQDLAGVWIGRWTGEDGSRSGSIEMIFSEDNTPRSVLAQMTVIAGARSHIARRSGRLMQRGVQFELVGGGEMILKLEGDNRLVGEFIGGIEMPAPRGSLELTRMQQ